MNFRPFPVTVIRAASTEHMQRVVAKLVTLSCWFEVTPASDDVYDIDVKPDVARHVRNLK